MIKRLLNHTLNFILKRLESSRLFSFFDKKRVVHNLGYDGTEKKRALFSYTFDAVCNPINDIKFSTNRNECLILLNKLIELDYIVDFVDCQNEFFSSSVKYDLVFGFGYPYRNACVKNDGVRILYCTEQHPKFSYQSEKLRIKYLKRRHSITWPVERSGTYYADSDFLNADKVIVLSDLCYEYLLDRDIKTKCDLAVLYPTGIEPKYIKIPNSDSGNDFVWFGSRGVVHKGLDVLIEGFLSANLDCSLHICGASKESISFLGDLLNDERIIFHGTVNVHSDKFYRILDASSFVISLSCSESNSTGVLTCMRHGLIPVVTTSTAVDVSFCGYVLTSYQVGYLQTELKKIFDVNSSELVRLRLALIRVVKNSYNIHSFSRSLDLLMRDLKCF